MIGFVSLHANVGWAHSFVSTSQASTKGLMYALVYYPTIEVLRLKQIRLRHDPTVSIIDPHIAVMFAVTESVGRRPMIDHLETVLSDWQPFYIQLGGFQRSPDHWLFLMLASGNEEIIKLHKQIYTGILAEFRRDDLDFVPHLGLGLFVKDVARYDWNDPGKSEFDERSYQSAMDDAQELQLDHPCLVDELHLIQVADEVFEWAGGERTSFSPDAKATLIKTFSRGK